MDHIFIRESDNRTFHQIDTRTTGLMTWEPVVEARNGERATLSPCASSDTYMCPAGHIFLKVSI